MPIFREGESTAGKIQFIAATDLSNPTQREKATLFMRSDMKHVYGTSLASDCFGMLDKLLNIFTFAASGIGPILDQNVQFDLKLATSNSISRSSYLPTPAEMDALDLLLNI